MSLSLEDLERRRSFVGASEVGLLFGLPSFGNRTISDLWHEKKYGVVHGGKGNASTDLGTRLEPVILAAAEDRLGERIIDRQKWITLGVNGATLDGRLESGPVVEAKTSGILGPSQLSSWGDDLSDDVPDMYALQLQAQLLVTGAELGYLAALIGGRGFAMFRIMPHAGLMSAIVEKTTAFMASLVDDLPPAEPPQLETLKRLRRQPNKILPGSDALESLWQRFEEAKATAKESEENKERLQREILTMLGDAEAAELSHGMITYYEQTTKYKAKPASETTFRVMRFSKERA